MNSLRSQWYILDILDKLLHIILLITSPFNMFTLSAIDAMTDIERGMGTFIWVLSQVVYQVVTHAILKIIILAILVH